MKLKKVLSMLLTISLIFFVSSPVFAQGTNANLFPNNEEETKEDINLDVVLTDEATGKQVKLETYTVGEVVKVPPETRSLNNGEQYKQTVRVEIPKTEVIANAIDSGTINGHRTDSTYCMGADFEVFYSRQDFQLGLRGGTARRINKVHLTYNVQELGTWFTEARVGYQATGIEMGSTWKPIDVTEDMLCTQAAYSFNGNFYPSKDHWVTVGGEPDILKATLKGVLYNDPRKTAWRVDVYVDVP